MGFCYWQVKFRNYNIIKWTILTAKIQRSLGKGQDYDPYYGRHTWNQPSQD